MCQKGSKRELFTFRHKVMFLKCKYVQQYTLLGEPNVHSSNVLFVKLAYAEMLMYQI